MFYDYVFRTRKENYPDIDDGMSNGPWRVLFLTSFFWLRDTSNVLRYGHYDAFETISWRF